MISEQVPGFELVSWKCWWNFCDVTQKLRALCSCWNGKSPPCSHIAAFPCRCQTWGCFQPPAASERCHDQVRVSSNHGSYFFWLCQPPEAQSCSVCRFWRRGAAGLRNYSQPVVPQIQLPCPSWAAVGCAGCFLGEGSGGDSPGCPWVCRTCFFSWVSFCHTINELTLRFLWILSKRSRELVKRGGIEAVLEACRMPWVGMDHKGSIAVPEQEPVDSVVAG